MKTAADILYDLGFGFEPKIDQLIIEAMEEYANQKVKEAIEKEDKLKKLPEYEECEAALLSDKFNALHLFIHDNEPAGFSQSELFREQLLNVVNMPSPPKETK